jgi:hypothetical protein
VVTTRDKVFGFLPGNGVHDIHMNQGNSQEFRRDDGVWQDGGLLLSTPEPGEPGAPDQSVRIVAALVNPAGPAPEAETVTLVNASSEAVDLTGWAILDREKRRLVLDAGPLAAGEAIWVPLGAPVALGNSGGLITLLDPRRPEGRRGRLHQVPGRA